MDANEKRPDAETPKPEDAGAEKPLRERVIDVLATIFDPEIPVNIWELGLIYELDVDEATGHVDIRMTLTSPACPVAESLPPEVQSRVAGLEDVEKVDVALVWEPPWSPQMLSDAARLTLGLM